MDKTGWRGYRGLLATSLALVVALTTLSVQLYRVNQELTLELKLSRHASEKRGADRVLLLTDQPEVDIRMSSIKGRIVVSIKNLSDKTLYLSPVDFSAANRSSSIEFYDAVGNPIKITPTVLFDRLDEHTQRFWNPLKSGQSMETSVTVASLERFAEFSSQPRYMIGHINVRYAASPKSTKVERADAVIGPIDLQSGSTLERRKTVTLGCVPSVARGVIPLASTSRRDTRASRPTKNPLEWRRVNANLHENATPLK